MKSAARLQPGSLHEILAFAARPSTNVDKLLEFVLQKALDLTDSEVGGAIFVYNSAIQPPALIGLALRGTPIRPPSQPFNPAGEGHPLPGSLVFEANRPCLIDDYDDDPVWEPWLLGGRSSLWVPISEEKGCVGCICVESAQPHHFGPHDVEALKRVAENTVTAISRFRLTEQLNQDGSHMEMIGASPAFLQMERELKLVAGYATAPVLIIGERGSGKELAARALHCWSNRRNNPFVPVLAAALAESLFADELFGHERYAFTGASRARLGKFKAADGGSLFLDEIGDMSSAVQSALLRIIERGELPRIGRDLPLRVDVRVIAATNQDPLELLKKGKFRQDLFDRLSVFRVDVPPLRARIDDIPLLASHFLRKYCREMRRTMPSEGKGLCQNCRHADAAECASAEFYQALQVYEWPGNVRELENVILRLLAHVSEPKLGPEHLLHQCLQRIESETLIAHTGLSLDGIVKNHIDRVIRLTNGNRTEAARLLGIPRSTLQSKMRRLKIEA